MRIQDFTDMNQFEELMSNWAKVTGLATVAVGADGEYISDCYNFTDFCIKYTRGSEEGKRRCEKCDREGKGCYYCHAGLMDFGIPITLQDGTILGSIVGGQVLPDTPDEEQFRKIARELGVNEDKYIEALNKVTRKSKDEIEACANLLGDVINLFVRQSYIEMINSGRIEVIDREVEVANNQIEAISAITKKIAGLSKSQNILALNASIEAARAGEAGRGFAIVAQEVKSLANTMAQASKDINEGLDNLSDTFGRLNK